MSEPIMKPPTTRIPANLVMSLKDELKLKYFIETGTFFGNTASWASQYFEKVFTIEMSEMLWQKASSIHSGSKNIQFILGDSRLKLKEIVDRLESSAIFWLDAHWSEGVTSGEGNECPLLEELKVIVDSRSDHCILVDDARLFLAPPPKPHSPDQWPNIASIINVLNSQKPRYIVVIDDVIVAVPVSARPLVVQYCQAINSDTPMRKGSLKLSILKILKRIYHSIKLR